MRLILWMTLLWATAAAAEVRFTLDVGATFRQTPEVDLADLSRADGFAPGDDSTPAALGLQVGFGVQLDVFEIGLDVAIAAGGLGINEVEERYFEAQDDVGGGTTLQVGARPMWVPPLSDDLQLMLGPRVLWHMMSAASGVGTARLTSLGAGGLLGLRWRTHRVTPTLDGHVQVFADVLAHIPLTTSVRRSADEVVFESDAPEGLFSSWSVAAAYCFTFR